MNLYEYIKQEHKNVALLFQKFEESRSEEQKIEITKSICKELSLHLEAEEETFYHSLMQYHEMRDLITHGAAEHDDLEKIISLIKNDQMAQNILESEVLSLKKRVEHHVKDEEGNIHPAAQEVLSEGQAEIIKEKMILLKSKIEKNY